MTHASRPGTLAACLLDVGGTLWPDIWPEPPGVATAQTDRLVSVACGAVDLADVEQLAGRLRSQVSAPVDGRRQDSDAQIAAVIEASGLASAFPDPVRVRQAMCRPAAGHVDLLPGARDLLQALAERQMRVVLVSNSLWRDGLRCLDDMAALGVGDLVHGAVTSIDVGWRKPHHRMFDAALASARARPNECLMIGDSEANDISPARQMGMRTVRVGMTDGQIAASDTHADLAVASLGSLATVLREGWT